jgi:hypothetical protein
VAQPKEKDRVKKMKQMLLTIFSLPTFQNRIECLQNSINFLKDASEGKQFRDGRPDLVEADEPGLESFRTTVPNLSPLARLIRPDRPVPLMSAPFFIRGKEMLPNQAFSF